MKKGYKKKKTVTRKKNKKNNVHYKRIGIAVPYFIFLFFFFGSLIYYLQFCLIYTYDNISPSSFAATTAFAKYGEHFEPVPPRPNAFKDEGIRDSYKEEINKNGQIIEHGSRNKKEIALTFDADMTHTMEEYLHSGRVKTYADKRVMDFLIDNHIKSTMFLTGMWMEMYPEETKMMAANSLFELANHSYSHPSFAGSCFSLSQIPSADYAWEMEKTQQLLKDVTHVENKYFRFPGGCYDQAALDLVKKEGMVTVHWEAVADDGFNTNTDQIINNVLNETKSGSVIVMHIGGEPNAPKTFDALQVIAVKLKERGFTFVTVSELLKPEPKIQAIDLKKYLLTLN